MPDEDSSADELAVARNLLASGRTLRQAAEVLRTTPGSLRGRLRRAAEADPPQSINPQSSVADDSPDNPDAPAPVAPEPGPAESSAEPSAPILPPGPTREEFDVLTLSLSELSARVGAREELVARLTALETRESPDWSTRIATLESAIVILSAGLEEPKSDQGDVALDPGEAPDQYATWLNETLPKLEAEFVARRSAPVNGGER